MAFGEPKIQGGVKIGHIFVINLDRQPGRWRRITNELDHVLDASGLPLSNRATRVSAVDAREHHGHPREGLVQSTYTLGEQLFVDPHPLASPDRLDLDERIDMSPQEIAVACSHIDVWRRIASGRHEYAMILEDDVWLRPRFARVVDAACGEMRLTENAPPSFDILYLSYKEVRYGAEKVRMTRSLFTPFRGLWCLSGYVLSKSGAEKLLRSLPVRGPVDLWLNHQFGRLTVYATVKTAIEQRLDEASTNCYSALPVLTRAGVLNTETPGVFRGRPPLGPVFAFGAGGSGLSSLAMALSMLGYRCCSDVDKLPPSEMQCILSADPARMFDAYVNIGSLTEHAERLAKLYPDGRLIVTVASAESMELSKLRLSATGDRCDAAHSESLDYDNIMQKWAPRALRLPYHGPKMWKTLCEFLRCVPPPSEYPYCDDLGQRLLETSGDVVSDADVPPSRRLPFDDGPWVASPVASWEGLPLSPKLGASQEPVRGPFDVCDDFCKLDHAMWQLRDDTFSGNLALFRPSNFITTGCSPAQLIIRKENLGVRQYSSAALSSRAAFLYGRFEAVLKPARARGVVTGMFLHRDSPRQEIDIEFVGRYPRQLLTNVYYNPGADGARFDYGYRGTPILIDLDFDASKDFHSYAIEWSPTHLRWYVDGRLVHQRATWAPTPIPHLPMRFHVNLWASRSRELAGRIQRRSLPTSCGLMSVRLTPAYVLGRIRADGMPSQTPGGW